MFLSNTRKSFLISLVCALVCLVFFQACGSQQANENAPISLSGQTKSKFPFPTKEPEVYQGDLVIGNGTSEQRYFVARKGDKWRFDIFRDNAVWVTELWADNLYFINHREKTYTIDQNANQKDYDPAYLNSLTWGFFRGSNYLEFEELERGAGVVKYKAKTYKDSKSEVLVTIDEATGIMVRQEITDEKGRMEQGSYVDYVYEVRDLKTDVDDSVFAVPAGYTKAARDQSRNAPANKKP